MYCTTCGKQIIDTARFCNFCGSPVQGAPFTAPTPSVPISQPMTAPAETAQLISEEIPSYTETVNPERTETLLSTESIQPESAEAPSYSEAVQPEGAETLSYAESVRSDSIETPPYPEAVQPDNIETLHQENKAASPYNIVPPQTSVTSDADNVMGTFSVPAPGQISLSGESAASLPKMPVKPLPERKYTFGHIMLCLGAVAIMAIVAGVFAGLYFSVV